ncbi:protein transport protein SEC16B homolog [Oryza brachyantha]|uniref:Protein transport protein sec16 n=1 Tax=Oryza brachyantha TaxID=4533 RepID=J3MAJ7_ORYBR|nr:protein transport protein SEC16B homolog [Oryza brachyantha]
MAMASDSDDADADFFDKLVDDDDAHTAAPSSQPEPDVAPPPPEAHAGPPPHHPPNAPAPQLRLPEAELEVALPPKVEGGSAKGVHTAVKQVQWTAFANTTGDDPFGEFMPAATEDAFFGGNTDQATQPSVVATIGSMEHSFSSGVGNVANSHSGWAATATEFTDHNTNLHADSTSAAAVDSTPTDPKYLESLYPGWKYDEATQQWYQVDTYTAQSNADNLGTFGVDSVQQQQQQFGISYLQNSSQAGLETIAEEGSTSWGLNESNTGATEYPSNMVFYAEYPGWYFDTTTQQWHSLESYQQVGVQTTTTAAALGGLVQTSDSYADDYSHQGQPQHVSLGYNNLAGSFYGSNQHADNQVGQQANVEPLESSNNHYTNINTYAHSTSQYTGSDDLQASHKGFGSSTSHQSSYKGFEPYTSHQCTSTGYHSGYKGSESSTVQPAIHQGFKPSTNSQNYKGFEPYSGHQSGYKGYEYSTDQIGQKEFGPSTDNQASHAAYGQVPSPYSSFNSVAKPQGSVPTSNMTHAQTHADSDGFMHFPNNYSSTGNSINFAQQQFISSNSSLEQFGHSPHEQRSSAGRPPHALVTFGFGGKLVVVRETSSMSTNFDSGNQGNSSGVVSILDVSEIISAKVVHPSIPNGSALGYFHALCRQPIPGPLVGGSAAAKDVNKWLDEIITGYDSSIREFQGGDDQKLLISLLKILCQHYGKLRSPFGSDPSQEGIDGPEMAVTKLFSSCKSSDAHKGEYGAIIHCMKNIPSDYQIQATAKEVQSLLVSGRRKEALQCAQEGQLWGPALILALQLGDKFYVDTVKKMAYHHFVSGSPLRTLCLLIAGQPADVFNVENPVDSNYGKLHIPQQSVESVNPRGMLDDWQENLAIITANRTKGDDLVITHLGDCLWKEKNEVAAAHSCYLAAELNIEPYSENSRICLIGADHLRCPRTFASPEAIQRTEVYEYAKVLGNSQYILLPFQPYKLIYAYMLVEVGKVSDSLRYCQACLKVLKASGRAPELEAWKQLFSSLEERIRTHQQGGYGTNLAPAKLVGKIFTSLDKSLSRMMGTQPSSLPPMPQGSSTERDSYSVPAATNFVNSQPAMAMSPLMSSVSEQSMSEMSGNSGPGKKVTHNRSVSEPDFGRNSNQGAASGNAQSSSSSGSSRFGWLLQKTMGLVSRSHHQAKLGEQNKFYYDEKLKRWVEEGADIPAEEPPLPPPPTKASFQNSVPDQNMNGPGNISYTANGISEARPLNPSEPSLGMPPMPPSQNQFSARGRMGVRSRYVDTFNKGGANAAGPSYSKPATPSMNPLSGATFFVPSPATVGSEQIPDPTVNVQQDQSSSLAVMRESSASPPPSVPSVPVQSSIQRYPSMDNIMTPSGSGNGSSFSRSRAASWSGAYSEQLSSNAVSRSPDGQRTMMQSPLIPGQKHSHSRSSSNSSLQLNNNNGLGEDLHEVEL